MNVRNFSDSDVTDDNDYDEFLFESIQRYDTLQMFNLENVPQHLLQLCSDSLCVASKRSNGCSELLKLQLPVKIMLPPEEEGRCKENNFRVLSGIYIDNPIYQIGKLGGDNSIITSEISISGLRIYSFPDSSLGIKNKSHNLDILPWTNPSFTVLEELSHVICSKCCHETLIQIDASVGKKIKNIKHPLYTSRKLSIELSNKLDPCSLNNITCTALCRNVIALLSTHDAEVFLHDLRTNDLFISLPRVSEAHTTEMWTLSGSDFMEDCLDYFGILSNTTSFCAYDIRKNGVLFQKKGENAPCENHRNMKLKFSRKERKFSISGMNGFVEIFGIKENNFAPVFTHKGHCLKKLSSVYVTDHLWLQGGAKEYVVSICDNKTLNCWN